MIVLILFSVWLGGALFFGSVMFGLTHGTSDQTGWEAFVLWLQLVGLALGWPLYFLRMLF